MGKTEFMRLMQRYVANIAITGPTLRNQGAEHVVEATREFLSKLDLSTLREIVPEGYVNQLDRWTETLRRSLPQGAQNWGTARKALNVFMVQVFLNEHLAREYSLRGLGHVLETPLDGQAARKLRKLAGRGRLPRWDSIKGLTPAFSQRYQESASELAAQHDVPRACLDMMLWRSEN